MIAEGSLVAIGRAFQVGHPRAVSHHLVQPASHQIRMSTEEPKIARHFRRVLKG
jgi:hypothetical protein